MNCLCTVSGIAGSSISAGAAGSFGAAGGYLIYPNKSNNNQLRGVYAK